MVSRIECTDFIDSKQQIGGVNLTESLLSFSTFPNWKLKMLQSDFSWHKFHVVRNHFASWGRFPFFERFRIWHLGPFWLYALIALQRHSPLLRKFYPSEDWLSSRCLTSVILQELVFPSGHHQLKILLLTFLNIFSLNFRNVFVWSGSGAGCWKCSCLLLNRLYHKELTLPCSC